MPQPTSATGYTLQSNPEEWSPPIHTGLSHPKEYLSERIENFVDSPSAAHNPGVYVLQFSLPVINNGDKRKLYKQMWLESKETLPEYIDELINAEKLLYVGYSKNIYTRLKDHINNYHTTTLAEVFPIHSIFDMYFYDTKEKAKIKEEYHTIDLANAYPEAYVHSR